MAPMVKRVWMVKTVSEEKSVEALRLLSSSRASLLQQVKERLHQTHVPMPRVRMVEKGAVLIPG